jgi:cell division protein FtsB
MQINTKYMRAAASDFIFRLRDIRFAGQVVFVVIVLLISWSGVKAIQLNYKLQKQIATTKQENEVQQLQNENLQLQNEYYNSTQYLELQARLNFGLANPGEQEILVPQNVALAYAPKVNTQNSEPRKVYVPALQQHINDWANFFFNRK